MSGYEFVNRNVLRRCQKIARDGADVTWGGRLFHMLAPETGNARSLYNKIWTIWESQSRRTSHTVTANEFTWCVRNFEMITYHANTGSKSFAPLFNSCADGQDCTRTESAAASIHQNCVCLRGKYVPTWSPTSGSHVVQIWALRRLLIQRIKCDVSYAPVRQFLERDMQMYCTAESSNHCIRR